MASKRKLKHDIKHVCNNLLGECVAASLYCDNKNIEDLNAIIKSIFALNSQFTLRISHPEPGLKAKVYYTHLKNAFYKQALEIADQIINFG